MMRFKRLLRRKSKPNVPVQTPATNQPPAQEDDSQLDPPPYSASSASQTDHNGGGAPQAIVSTPQETAAAGLLDPNLNFTAAQMEQQWRAKDKAFARAVVQFVAERFDGNLRGWAGYKYTYINDQENPPRKECAWDDIVGYSAWGYRARFKQVGILVKRDFEKRGFEVKKCEIYCSQDGIYVAWTLDFRKPLK